MEIAQNKELVKIESWHLKEFEGIRSNMRVILDPGGNVCFF